MSGEKLNNLVYFGLTLHYYRNSHGVYSGIYTRTFYTSEFYMYLVFRITGVIMAKEFIPTSHIIAECYSRSSLKKLTDRM
jgi:hypothetical protein